MVGGHEGDSLPTERHILDGLGWYEYQQFASPGTGRVFVLSGPIDHPSSSEYGPQIAATAPTTA